MFECVEFKINLFYRLVLFLSSYTFNYSLNFFMLLSSLIYYQHKQSVILDAVALNAKKIKDDPSKDIDNFDVSYHTILPLF